MKRILICWIAALALLSTQLMPAFAYDPSDWPPPR